MFREVEGRPVTYIRPADGDVTSAVTAAAVYVRISEDRAGGGLGVARQEADCRALCEQLGWSVAEVYSDNDLSAYSGKRRPAYERLLVDVADGRRDAVVAWHLDRLTRRPAELESFIDVANAAGAALATVTGDVDIRTPTGRLLARQLGALARYESEHKSERIRRKARELAERGRISGGGTRPYGFESDRVTIRPGEAAVIRDLAQRVLAGSTTRSLVADLTARGVPTVTGAPWTSIVVNRVLTSPRTAGLREHRGDIVGPAVWEAILDRDTWDAVRAILTDPSRRMNFAGGARRYLLSGIARCDLCGARLRARPTQTRLPSLTCVRGPNFDGCGGIRIAAPPLDVFVTDLVLDRLDDPAVLAALTATDREDGNDELALLIRNDERRLDQLADAFADDPAGDAIEFRRASQRIRARLEDNRSRLARARRHSALAIHGTDVRSRWSGLDLPQRRAVVTAVIDAVWIGPAVRGRNFFDPNRVRVTWAGTEPDGPGAGPGAG